MKKIPIAGPWVTDLEIDYVKDAAKNSWYENYQDWNIRLEETFCKYSNSRYAVSLPHATSGIHLALLAFGIGEGDEVIVPDATWIASAAPIKYVGAQPVFADIDPDTWCICPKSVKKLITDKTKAIIPVDLYGSMPDFNFLRKITNKYGIKIIEDAAEAVGSELNSKQAGTFGDVGVYSFHGSKTISTGEGGLLVTDNEEVYRRILFLRDHGRQPGDSFFFNTEIAYKYKMSSLQAAFGTAQVERINELVHKKRQIFSWYKERLSGNDALILNSEPEAVKNSYWLTTLIYDKKFNYEKKYLMDKFLDKGIVIRPFFNQLSKIPAFIEDDEAEKARKNNLVANDICSRGINLPSALCLEEKDIDYVCDFIKEIFL